MEDFFLIPRFLYELDLGYRFYLEHHFVNKWETVLYALPGDDVARKLTEILCDLFIELLP